jgi:cellulose synthase/poly-beta-1,6-N-acetylglucosamine synthase-like glycosyltransferase
VSDTVLVAAFWTGIAATLYTYLGFPFLLRRLQAFTRDENTAHPASRIPHPDAIPPVTVIIPAHNEQRHIEARIRNVLASAYPRERLDILVVSDASTDRTNEIASGFAADGVRLVVQQTRQGKTAGLNRAISVARGDIVVFTDANSAYPPGAIQALADRLADPRVGLVTGYTRYTSDGAGDVSEVTNFYTRLERHIKLAESRWGCCVGADGAIFAMRRALYRPLREDDINDFVLPLGVIEQGYRCEFTDEAFCRESPGENLETEFRRQSRISNRTLRALWRHRRLLNPFRFPVFSFFLFSHKVTRFLVPLFLGLAAASLVMLAPAHPVYMAAAIILTIVVALAMLPVLLPGMPSPRPFGVLRAFLTINAAILSGWSRFVRGESDTTWQHDRSSSIQRDSEAPGRVRTP